MTPITCTDVDRDQGLPLYTVKVYDIDHPVNFHSYESLFFEQGRDLNALLEKAKERIKEYETF